MELDAKADLYTGLVLVFLAGAGLLWLVPAQIQVSATGLYDLSPRLVPRLLLGLTVLLGLGVMRNGWRARRVEVGHPASRPEPGAVQTDGHGNIRRPARELGVDAAVWIASSVAVMAALKHVGFIPTATLLLAAWLLFAGVRSRVLVASLALGVPITLERLCWYALTVQLP